MRLYFDLPPNLIGEFEATSDWWILEESRLVGVQPTPSRDMPSWETPLQSAFQFDVTTTSRACFAVASVVLSEVPGVPGIKHAAVRPWASKDEAYMKDTMAASSDRIMLGPLVAAIDQGTSSTRFLVSHPA